MPTMALQIRFSSSEMAKRSFDRFPPSGLECIESWMRRVDGDSQFILLDVAEIGNREEFRRICSEFPGVVEVRDISESECLRRCRNRGEGPPAIS
jgi:hypothetical protein